MAEKLIEALKLSLNILVGKDVTEEAVLVLVEQSNSQKRAIFLLPLFLLGRVQYTGKM